MAAEWIELQALRYTNYRSLGTLQRTGIPGPEGSAIKLRWSEQNQRMTKLGRELLGPDGILDDGWWHHQQLRSRGNTIEAGTLRSAPQHRRRARARPAEEQLMDFALQRGPARAEAAGARLAFRALPARPRLGRAAGRPLGGACRARLARRVVAEDEGGVGLGFVEEALLLEELGYALYPGPYLATIGFALAALGPEDRAAVAAGARRSGRSK